MEQGIREIPPSWLQGDQDELWRLMEKLRRRRGRVADLVLDSKACRTDPLRNLKDPRDFGILFSGAGNSEAAYTVA